MNRDDLMSHQKAINHEMSVKVPVEVAGNMEVDIQVTS